MSEIIHNPNQSLSDEHAPLTFNFAAVLPGRAASIHTERAYFRWVDRYLADNADMQTTKGTARAMRMQSLPVETLQSILSASQLRAWLGVLLREGHGKQGIDQARASIVTLADLLAEANWLADTTAAAMARVRPPKAEQGQRPGRWLSPRQLREMIRTAEQIATSENQALRNTVVMSMLCTMALRRDEITNARWDDLSIQNDRLVLRVHGKGKKTAIIDVPNPVWRALMRWQKAIEHSKSGFQLESPLLRRIWKGGVISKEGLTTEGIWYLVDRTASHADVGHVAPHDLRRSVAGALYDNDVPIEKISRLLRHNNVAVTEKYLSRLPQVNEGAVLMSGVLGMEDDGEDWFDFD